MESNESTSAPGVGDLIQAAGSQALDSEDGVRFGGYLLEKVLGIGGMGATVYLGRSESKKPQEVAIKVLPKEFLGDEATTRRFDRESEILKGLAHENVVEVFEVGVADDGSRFIVMEYVEGGSLARLLAEQTKLSTRRKVRIVASLCTALTELHSRDITHRDIKPGNILLTSDRVAKLADFGLARYIDPTTLSNPLTQTGDTLGTVAYMAPEQLGATKKANARSDIYSLGIVLYQLFTGIMPVGHVRPLAEVRPDLSHFDSVVMRAIKAEPELRFESAGEFGDALVLAHRKGRSGTLTRRRLVGGLAAAGTAAAVWKVWPRSTAQNPFWTDLETVQQRFGSTDASDVSLRFNDTQVSFRLHRTMTPLSYRIEAVEVPDSWKAGLAVDEMVMLEPFGEVSRLGLKHAEFQIPENARVSNSTLVSLGNPPDVAPLSDDFTRLYQSCEVLNLLDARGALARTEGGIVLDARQCQDFDGFCQVVGIGDLTAAEVATDEAAESALIRVGAYQLLRTPEMPNHPAIVTTNDFKMGTWETRSRLEIVAAMIAEPWLLSQVEPRMRPVYSAAKGDQPATQIVGAWLGIS